MRTCVSDILSRALMGLGKDEVEVIDRAQSALPQEVLLTDLFTATQDALIQKTVGKEPPQMGVLGTLAKRLSPSELEQLKKFVLLGEAHAKECGTTLGEFLLSSIQRAEEISSEASGRKTSAINLPKKIRAA